MTFTAILLVSSLLNDGGPLYSETDTSYFIVEPFNALSSLAYLIPAVYWMRRLKGRYGEYSFFTSCLPFLVLGGIGSTLYHAFRNSPYLLYLDVLPIAVVTLMVSIYFWIKVLPKRWQIVFVLVPFFLIRYFVHTSLASGRYSGSEVSVQTIINISYFITGTMIFLPALLLMIRLKFRYATYVVLSCLLFMLGLFFREADTWDYSVFPMGTHWLWHISTAAGTWVLGFFLFKLRKQELEQAS